MPELTPNIAAQVVATATRGAAEAADALARGLDAAGVQIEVGEAGVVDLKALPEGFDGPGLAVVLMVGTAGVLALVPESSGLLPAWCSAPDATGESKLTTLAQELGMILLPEEFMPADFKAGYVKSLAGAVARGGVAEGAAIVPLRLVGASSQGQMSLIWPASKPTFVVGAKPAEPAKPAAKPSVKTEKPKPAAAPPKPTAAAPIPSRPARAVQDVADLPEYSRSLLRIQVPIVVTLAKKRQTLGRIVELGPGSIIQFDKSCEEMLELDVGRRPVAMGEAVKVGDKFGLRITSMILPEERFQPLKPHKSK